MVAKVQLTDDGHHVVIQGRRWRATDPELPEAAAAVLRRELMSARRAVGAAKRGADAESEQSEQSKQSERAARDRVQAAKVALGERGTPWWEQSEAERRERWEGLVASLNDTHLRETIIDLLSHRDRGATICPSEVARAVGGDDWRSLMEPTRRAARALVEAGEVEITQHGEAVAHADLETVTGPIRIRRVS